MALALPGGTPRGEDAGGDGGGVVDADYTIRRKPLLHRLFPSLDPDRRARKGRLALWTITRDEVDRPPWVEYEARLSYVKRADLPREAVHVTGQKGVYAVVGMEPRYPEYADPAAETDEDGNFVRPHNYFDAYGYFKWFADQRIKKGYDALGHLDRIGRPIDWQRIATVAAVVVVVAAVVGVMVL